MLNGRNNALRHSLNIILCPSIFWGPRLIARSPRRRRREKNLEPQKIDGLVRFSILLFASVTLLLRFQLRFSPGNACTVNLLSKDYAVFTYRTYCVNI